MVHSTRFITDTVLFVHFTH